MLRNRRFLLLMAVTPILLWILVSVFVFLNTGFVFGAENSAWNAFMFQFTMLCSILIYVSVNIYIVFLYKYSLVPDNKRAIWAFFLLMGNVMAMLIFWNIHVKTSHINQQINS